MSIKNNTTDLVNVKAGTGNISKVMVGTDKIWPPVPAGKAANKNFMVPYARNLKLDTWTCSGWTYDVPWISKDHYAGEANGTGVHTISFTDGYGNPKTMTNGNQILIIAIAPGNGTWTVPSGYTDRGGNDGTTGEMEHYMKTSNGTETSVTLTYSLNTPIAAAVFELPSGVYINQTGTNATSNTFGALSLSGYGGQEMVFAAIGGAITTASATPGFSYWGTPWVKDTSITVPDNGTQDGVWLHVGHQLGMNTTSVTPTVTSLALPGGASTTRIKTSIGLQDSYRQYAIPGVSNTGQGIENIVSWDNSDIDCIWNETMVSDDMCIRYKIGRTTNVSQWFNSILMKATDSKSSYLACHFRDSGLYLQRNLEGSFVDWRGLNTAAASMTTVGTIVEFSCINNYYSIVFELPNGTRSEPVAPYLDSGNTYGSGPTKRRVGIRLSRNSGATYPGTPCQQLEVYDISVWPIHSASNNTSTQSYGTANNWSAVPCNAIRTGYPQTQIAGAGWSARGEGTIKVRTRVVWSTSGTAQTRVLKNGTPVWTSGATTGTTIDNLSTDIYVVAGDIISMEASRTTTGTINTGCYIMGEPVASAAVTET